MNRSVQNCVLGGCNSQNSVCGLCCLWNSGRCRNTHICIALETNFGLSPSSLQILVRSNNLGDKINVLSGRIEEISLPESVDVIVSEPMGYMLFNERMLESYLHSKKWLKSNGKPDVWQMLIREMRTCKGRESVHQIRQKKNWFLVTASSVVRNPVIPFIYPILHITGSFLLYTPRHHSTTMETPV